MEFSFQNKVMNLCRICLSKDISRDISDLQIDSTSYVDVMLFCLDIKIDPAFKISRKICLICFDKIISFYSFKTLALKNDSYLRSFKTSDLDRCLQFDSSQNSDVKIKRESTSNIKKELPINNLPIKEDSEQDSDDEFLSVLKKVKECVKLNFEENVHNTPLSTKKKLCKENSQMCPKCGKTVRNLKRHLDLHKPLGNRRIFTCHLCDKVFHTPNGKHRHVKFQHFGLRYHCDICNKDLVSLKQHNQTVHNYDFLPFSCVSCGQKFRCQTLLTNHMLSHTKDRPFECDVCQKTFRDKAVLSQHKRQVHEKEKLHLCQYCSKSFFKKYHFQVHLRTHTKERPYKCSECGKHFISCSSLKTHRETHSRQKKYQCEFCDMAFTVSGYLTNHLKSHSRERNYPCQYCGAKFIRSDHRKRHERTAHERHILGL